MARSTLIITRHAHRDKPDEALSEKGRKQAKAITRHWTAYAEKALLSKVELEKIELLSSPKLRCTQTLEPLAEFLEKKIEIVDCLDESESARDLVKRLADFTQRLKKSPAEITVACSHGDWIPEFTERFLGTRIDLNKAGWIEVEMTADGPSIRSVI